MVNMMKTRPSFNYKSNIMGDQLLLNFGAKFQRQFIISHVKLQNCHGNRSDAAKMASGFEDITDSDVAALKDAPENLNTRKSTVNWLRVFENWCDENALDKSAEKLPEQLDKVFERFYASVRKQDGTDYEPGYLKVMQAALDRHLKEKGYSLSIIKDREFLSSRKVLEGKARNISCETKAKENCQISHEA